MIKSCSDNNMSIPPACLNSNPNEYQTMASVETNHGTDIHWETSRASECAADPTYKHGVTTCIHTQASAGARTGQLT